MFLFALELTIYIYTYFYMYIFSITEQSNGVNLSRVHEKKIVFAKLVCRGIRVETYQ